MADHLFVYGTLQPGDVRWPFLAPYVVDGGEPDRVNGRVYDTGLGYPAASFGDSGTIHGRRYRLKAESIDEALAVLDAEEASVAGGFHRVVVTTHAGIAAHAYAFGGGIEVHPIPTGRWTPAASTVPSMRAFRQVDVFTAEAYAGNPLGVVLDGTGLSTEQMQRFTDWTNLSECTFLLPPTDEGADYRVRIFCPGRELPFAGHPTLGSCHTWLEAGGTPANEGFVVQQCGAGLVRIRRDESSGRLAFAAPALLRFGPLDDGDLDVVTRGLGLQPEEIVAHSWCDNGPNWCAVLLRDAERVLAVRPDAQLLAGRDVGVVGPHPSPATSEPAWELRAFFPGVSGLAEDPVTGSLNAAVAQWLIGAGIAAPSYVAAQGTALGRRGRIHVEQDGDTIWIGGSTVTCIDGGVAL